MVQKCLSPSISLPGLYAGARARRAADVAVVLLGFDLAQWHETRVRFDILPLALAVDDLRDVLGMQEVLRFSLAIFPVGIDQEDVPTGAR